ncbi:MAG: gliding motility-associated C-terminal domain-containing protein [Bacteroidota bacterium]
MKNIYLGILFSMIISSASSQNFTVLGNASFLGGCDSFQLTPDAGNQAGAIFQNQTINLNNSFDFSFSVFLGCRNGSDAADGIVFVLTSNPNGLGNTGEGLGYAGGNQPYSIGVEFDTWENGNAGDPSYDHIGINSAGLYSHNLGGAVPALPGSGNIDNCQWYSVRIVWDVSSNTFSVYFNGVLRQQVVIPNMVGTHFGGNPIVNWGWSGATGGGTNDQRVAIQNISSWAAGVDYKSCSTTVQFSDVSTSSLGSIQSWAWSFGDGGTSTLQNPVHTYAGQNTYIASLTITAINGCTNTYSHPITINPPIVIAPTITPPPCNGGTNGGITVVPSGGFGPGGGLGGYRYQWSNGTTQPALVGAGAGTYTLTVTDGICTTTAQFTVNQNPPLTATTSHTDATCGANNGTATIVISGGTGTYYGTPIPNPVNWGPSFPGTIANGLAPGTYIADFQDSYGCSAALQYRETIGSLPCGISSSITQTNVSCFGGSNGSATLTVTGGSGGSVPGWTSMGGGVFTRTGLTAGIYSYNYNDANPSLNFSGSVTITQPATAITASLATVNTSCANTNDGQALASVGSGGTSPYTYSWSRGTVNGAVSSGLSPGGITVTITDANSCIATASGNITGPPILTINVTSIDDSCYQSQKGSATANVSGGNPPYLFYWSNISSAQTNLSLGVGSYTVTVTDDKGCTITGSATINQPTPFTHTLTATNIVCRGAATGTITITPSGGTPGYSYVWNPGTVSGGSPTGLAAGQYNVTVMDGNNCERPDSVILTQPSNGLVVTTSHTNVTCPGANNGTLTINISGGTPPYNYGGIPVPAGITVIPGLPDSTYAGNIADANGCLAAVSETITEPAPQSLAVVSVTDNICNGGTAGAITVDFVNATGTATYNWNPGGAQPASRTGLTAGVYNITGTDQNTCTVSASVTVNEPAAPVMTVTVVDAACFGGNGTATANPVGGGPFTYTWSIAGTNQTITAPAGTYSVAAVDANSCNQSATFIINEASDISIAETHTDLLCFGDANGTITLTPTGGTGPAYTYVWSPNVSTTNSAASLIAGSYAVTVTSANVSCFGFDNGSITITASGGTGPYTYAWNPNVSTTNSATGLAPATYTVTVADANNCSLAPSITITQPGQPLSLVPDSTNLTCFQSNDGTASVAVSGGTIPYTYTWNPNVGSGNSASSLAAGVYNLTVSDDNACSATVAFNITQPTQLTTTETHVDISCFGEVTGAVYVTASGGTGSYTYLWNPNVSTVDSAVNIAAGNYSVTISDANNCSALQTATVTQPLLLTLSATAVNVLCNGDNSGSINSVALGGTPAYSFTATDGTNTFTSSSGQFPNLLTGNYSILVTDQNQCSASASALVNEPAVLSSVVAVSPALCYNTATGSLVVTMSGGVSPFHYTLSNGDVNTSGIFSGLAAGTYHVSVTDANACPLSDAGVITEPDPVLISVSPNPVEVNLGESLQLTTTTNQTGNLVYRWTPAIGLSCSDCANPIFNGIYSQPYELLVTTIDGCTGSADFVVTVIPNYDVFIPNVFTPDGSGANDAWQLFGNLEAFKQMNISVFNRWGEKVFESSDVNFKWDGKYRGEKVPPGVYVYTAKFVWLNNHSDSNYHGTVTVLH